MFSMAGVYVFLPFLPMLPSQTLLNNLLYDNSQMVIPSDNVDQSFMKKPQHWNISLIRRKKARQAKVIEKNHFAR